MAAPTGVVGLKRPGSRKVSPRGVATAALVGTTIEWYDFFVHGTSVVLVLGPLFFVPTTH